jgi:ribonuclease P protein component
VGRFPRAARLTRRGDIDRVFRQGRKVVDRQLVAFLLPAPEGVARWRLGLSVSGKLGHAPARNRIKRVLREAFRRCAPPPPPHDLVLVARAGVAPEGLADAAAALQRVLQRAARGPAPRAAQDGAPPR